MICTNLYNIEDSKKKLRNILGSRSTNTHTELQGNIPSFSFLKKMSSKCQAENEIKYTYTIVIISKLPSLSSFIVDIELRRMLN